MTKRGGGGISVFAYNQFFYKWKCLGLFFFVSFFREKVKTILVKRMRSLRWMKGGFLFGERMKGGVRMDWTARPNNSGEGDVGGGE